ncbi:MAG: RidA family protein [Steroidobacteraceae bacterium]|nr:RidA family protein [Steroidobacteraceae bacterium]
MKMTPVNPWKWQDAFGFSQAMEVTGAQRVLYVAGQTSVDAEGNPLHAGNMAAQLAQALDNLETVLAKAGMTLANVVRLNYYVTNVKAYLEASATVAERLARAGCKPPGTLLGVASLFHPDIVVELEATAVA